MPVVSRDALARIAPFALFIVGLAVRGAWRGIDGFDARWLYALQAGAALVALVAFSRRYVELRSAPRGAREWGKAIAVGVSVFVLWIAADASWMRVGEPVASYVATRGDGAIDWSLATLRLTSAVLIVPIVEELFWRSFLMRWLDDRDFLRRAPGLASHFAVFSSSAVFALAHDRWFAALLAGLAYAGLYRRTGWLWISVGAHALTNALLGAWVLAHRDWMLW